MTSEEIYAAMAQGALEREQERHGRELAAVAVLNLSPLESAETMVDVLGDGTVWVIEHRRRGASDPMWISVVNGKAVWRNHHTPAMAILDALGVLHGAGDNDQPWRYAARVLGMPEEV